MKKLLSLVALVFILLSCGQSAKDRAPTKTDIQTVAVVVDTHSVKPEIITTYTATLPPTQTAKPTYTQTATSTLVPAAQTAEIKTKTQEIIAMGKTSTAIEKSINATGTAEIRSQQRTSTQIAKQNTQATAMAFKTMIAQYQTVEPKKLITYPSDFIGQYVRFDIKIFNFIDEYSIQGYIIGGNYDPVIIEFKEPYRDIYDDEIITIFGVVTGKQSGINMFGGEINQVSVNNAWFRK